MSGSSKLDLNDERTADTTQAPACSAALAGLRQASTAGSEGPNGEHGVRDRSKGVHSNQVHFVSQAIPGSKSPHERSLEINETITRFDYPQTLISEYSNWVVLLHPDQVTLGSMVLACKSDAEAMSGLSAEIFAELSEVVKDLEGALRVTFHHDKINYLLLMMVDKNVHFHVLPRYEKSRSIEGVSFEDTSWPGPPDLSKSLTLSAAQRSTLMDILKSAWRKSEG